MGVDHLILERFSLPFAQHSAEWFVREIIHKRLRAQMMVVGYDFRFGRARAGSVDTIKRLLPNIEVKQVTALTLNEEIVSSSAIRQKVQKGHIEQANVLLGRSYSIEGVVVLGAQRGRTLGFPTANVETDFSLIPHSGVYAVLVRVDLGIWHKAIANLGRGPTFNGKRFQIEVHIFDFQQDIYGSDSEIQFIKRLRSEHRFTSSQALQEQLKKDVEHARAVLD